MFRGRIHFVVTVLGSIVQGTAIVRTDIYGMEIHCPQFS